MRHFLDITAAPGGDFIVVDRGSVTAAGEAGETGGAGEEWTVLATAADEEEGGDEE